MWGWLTSSRVKPSTPWPQDRTKLHDEPYLPSDTSSIIKKQDNSHSVTSSDHLFTRSQDILDFTVKSVLLHSSVLDHNEPGSVTYDFVDTKDCTNINTSVNVTRSVQGVEYNTAALSAPLPWFSVKYVLSTLGVTNDDSLIDLLRNHDATFPTSPQGVHHDIITEHIQFLLIFTLNIGSSGQSNEIDEPSFTDVGCDVFRCDLSSVLRPSRNDWKGLTWMATRSMVRSPVALSPRALCWESKCLVKVIKSVAGGSSSADGFGLDIFALKLVWSRTKNEV